MAWLVLCLRSWSISHFFDAILSIQTNLKISRFFKEFVEKAYKKENYKIKKNNLLISLDLNKRFQV